MSDTGKILKQRRTVPSLKLKELSAISGVSVTHLDRIERGERFHTARLLQRIAKPLGFVEEELFNLALYLTPHTPIEDENYGSYYQEKEFGPYVARVLAQESVQV